MLNKNNLELFLFVFYVIYPLLTFKKKISLIKLITLKNMKVYNTQTIMIRILFLIKSL